MWLTVVLGVALYNSWLYGDVCLNILKLISFATCYLPKLGGSTKIGKKPESSRSRSAEEHQGEGLEFLWKIGETIHWIGEFLCQKSEGSTIRHSRS